MKSENPFSSKKIFSAQGLQHNQKFYYRFGECDIEQLQHYCEDLDYDLLPEQVPGEPDYDPLCPIRFRVVNRKNPALFGWISKGDGLVYGFYQGKAYKDKYPITWQVEHRAARRASKHNRALGTPEDFRFAFGITDLEPEAVEHHVRCNAETIIRHAMRSWYNDKGMVQCSRN